MSSLPPGFEAAQDSDGYTYYYNLNTGESTYDVPGGGGESHLQSAPVHTSTHTALTRHSNTTLTVAPHHTTHTN